MKTYLECFSCFLNHGLDISRRVGLDEPGQRDVLNRIAGMIPTFDLETKPPTMSLEINRMIRELTGVEDPFFEEKRRSNDLAMAAADQVRRSISQAEDRLKRAVEYAIAGNIIDLGAKKDLDIDAEMEALVAGEEEQIERERPEAFRLARFRQELEGASTLLYITDNAGEIVFDMLFIEVLQELFPGLSITVAVRDRPVINDATLEDARDVGLDRLVPVISSGSAAPGTPLELCSPDFLERFESADMVIAKGQGNYETLSDAPRPVYLLFKVKCPVVARSSGGELGDVMLMLGGDQESD
jgi:damage-control phosphatase, subfamily I